MFKHLRKIVNEQKRRKKARKVVEETMDRLYANGAVTDCTHQEYLRQKEKKNG